MGLRGSMPRNNGTAPSSSVTVQYNSCPGTRKRRQMWQIPQTTQRGDHMSEKKAFLDAWEREAATTVKVLRAYPGGKETMKPHTTCRSAQELAWTFAFEGVAATQALQGEFKFPPA